MAVSNWTEANSQRVAELWSEYQQQHDLEGLTGKTAGVDPTSGSIWIGESIQDVVARRDADGVEKPLFFIRIGFPAYYRKGQREALCLRGEH